MGTGIFVAVSYTHLDVYKRQDWGFVAVERPGGERARIACFAMVCHHCGGAHVEFFPNARQENPVSYTHLDVYKRQVGSPAMFSGLPA